MFMPGDDSSRYMVCLIGRFAGCAGVALFFLCRVRLPFLFKESLDGFIS